MGRALLTDLYEPCELNTAAGHLRRGMTAPARALVDPCPPEPQTTGALGCLTVEGRARQEHGVFR